MEINAGSYVYSTSRLNCNSWRIWFRTAISLKFDSFLHRNKSIFKDVIVLNQIPQFSDCASKLSHT